MGELLVLVLVFAAVVSVVWVAGTLLAELGLDRGQGRYVRGGEEASRNPLYRFTTPERLRQTGWYSALIGSGLMAAGLIAGNQVNPLVVLPVTLGVGAVCYRIPRWWIERRIRVRRAQFKARLMDLTLGLANGLRSGAALPQSLEFVTRDIGGPMGEEFGLVLSEYRLGVDLPECLARLCERMPSEDLTLLVTSVRLTLQSGGSLADVLDKMTETVRRRTDFQQRLETMTAQGRFEAIAMAAAPLVAFAILYYLDPELMKPLLTTQVGWCALGGVVTLETIGFILINKIVTIEV